MFQSISSNSSLSSAQESDFASSVGPTESNSETVRGQLEVWSEQEAGTKVDFTVPGSVAYVAHEKRRFRLFARKVALVP
jgi:hypothetical protein